jgi:pSer/pThr/pTyr-binding forkhead associated (FHA) protein
MGPLYISILRDSVFDRIYEVKQPESIIGRDSECDLILADPYVSRRHAIILLNGASKCVIRDLQSKNGILINGRCINGESPLKVGDRMVIGRFSLRAFPTLFLATSEVGEIEETALTEGVSEPSPDHGQPAEPRLTPAQMKVFEGFLDGLIEKEIAARCHLSVHTVHHHAKAIYKAFSVSTRGELILRWASRREKEILER